MHKQLKCFSGLFITSCCALCRNLHTLGQGEGGGVIHRVDTHMVGARLGCNSAIVGTGYANSCPGCMETEIFPCTGSSFLAGKAGWARSGCLTTESADYCLISGLGFSFGVRAWTEMEIWFVKGMYRLK